MDANSIMKSEREHEDSGGQESMRIEEIWEAWEVWGSG
jgi:hypothetical protein